MLMDIICHRNAEFAHEARYLPAETYNQARMLLLRAHSGCFFVPIRAMQYLAILDEEEFVFVDGNNKHLIDIAWRDFRPQQRTALNDPVAFEAVYYSPGASRLMMRLQAEFPRALDELSGRVRFEGEGKVLTFPLPAQR
jgi:hypothetical protein